MVNGRQNEPELEARQHVYLLLLFAVLFMACYGLGWYSGATEATESKCEYLCSPASIKVVRPEGKLFDVSEWTCFCER